MASRVLLNYDRIRCENAELLDKVNDLKEALEIERKIVNELHDSYGRVHDLYMHELKVNASLVKHSHILFETLNKMQQECGYLPNIKKVKIDKSRVGKPHKPSQDELEALFMESIADGKKD